MHHYLAWTSIATVLGQEDPLPGSEREFAVGDGDNDGCGRDHRSNMRGHIIRPLFGMSVDQVILWGDLFEPGFQVVAGRRVGGFLDDQTGRRVAYKQGTKTELEICLRNHLGDFAGDFDHALTGSVDGDGFLHGPDSMRY